MPFFIGPSAAARVIPTRCYLIYRGLRPRKGDPHAWYDRAIRVGGGMVILAVYVFAMYSTPRILDAVLVQFRGGYDQGR
jgi:hypothetical protein